MNNTSTEQQIDISHLILDDQSDENKEDGSKGDSDEEDKEEQNSQDALDDAVDRMLDNNSMGKGLTSEGENNTGGAIEPIIKKSNMKKPGTPVPFCAERTTLGKRLRSRTLEDLIESSNKEG